MTLQKMAYSVKEAAQQVGCSIATIQQNVEDGNLAPRLAGTEVVIRHEDLAVWVSQLPTVPRTVNDLQRPAENFSEQPNSAQTAASVDGAKPIPQDRPMPTASETADIAPSRPHRDENDLLTPEDVGRLLQVSPGTIANWRTNKKGPDYIRIGGVVRYGPRAVTAWVEAQPSG